MEVDGKEFEEADAAALAAGQCSLIKDQFTCTATPSQPEYYRIMCYIAPEQGRPLEIEVALG
jgi:hypothetical protein